MWLSLVKRSVWDREIGGSNPLTPTILLKVFIPMPHIIVEHSQNLEPQINIPNLLQNLHQALTDCGIDQARIKTRAVRLEHCIVGAHGPDGMMAHVTLLLLAGRDIPTKKQYGQALHDVLCAHIRENHPDCALTLEVRDMEPETYIL